MGKFYRGPQKFPFLFIGALLVTVTFLIIPVAGAGAATQIAILAGNSQSATVGTAVSVPPGVVVKDANNNVVSGVPVTFIASGGSSVTDGTKTTDENGVASAGWTLSKTAGKNTLTVTGSGLAGSPVIFEATGTAGSATTLLMKNGEGQTAAVGTAVLTQPSVLVTDAWGNPKSGIIVTFMPDFNSGTVGTLSSNTTMTNLDGIASSGIWILGPTPGKNTMVVTSPGLAGSPVTFTAMGITNTTPHAPAITSITPATGSNNGYIRGVVIQGTNFTPGTTVVRLVFRPTLSSGIVDERGRKDILMENPLITATTITGDFSLDGATEGARDVVLIADGGTCSLNEGFTVVNPPAPVTVTAISPANAKTNSTVTVTVNGTGFGDYTRVRLVRSGYNDITALGSPVSATSVSGRFDLSNKAPGTWDVCVLDIGAKNICGPEFTITPESPGQAGVPAGNETNVPASLTPVSTNPPPAVPANTPTPKSSGASAVIVGALCIGIGLMRKNQ